MLIEVLVTMVILAFGMLGLIGLEAKVQVSQVEAYQRAQAVTLLTDMSDRISANRSDAASYASSTIVYGTGHTDTSPCPTTSVSARDLCEWSVALKGAAEQRSSGNVGAMIGARGCITQVQAPNPAAGACTPGIYLVSVAWQGLTPTASVSGLTCANAVGTFGSSDALRRVVATRVGVGMPECS